VGRRWIRAPVQAAGIGDFLADAALETIRSDERRKQAKAKSRNE